MVRGRDGLVDPRGDARRDRARPRRQGRRTCSTGSRTRPSPCASRRAARSRRARRRRRDRRRHLLRPRGQWPFKRSLHARAIDALRRAGASRSSTTSSSPSRRPSARTTRCSARSRRAGDVVLATTETDGHGGTNVLGGDENLAPRGRARRVGEPRDRSRRRHPPLPATPPAACAASPSSTSGWSPASPLARAFDGGGAWIDYRGPPGTVPTVSFSDLVSRQADPDALSATASWSSARPRPRCRTSTRRRPPTTA